MKNQNNVSFGQEIDRCMTSAQDSAPPSMKSDEGQTVGQYP